MKKATALYSEGGKTKQKKVELSLEHGFDGLQLLAKVDEIWLMANLYEDSNIITYGWWLGEYYLPPCEIESFLKDEL